MTGDTESTGGRLPTRRPLSSALARWFGAGLLIHAMGGSLAMAQAVDSTTLRLTEVELSVSNDTHYDGVYRARGVSRVCGKLDLMMPHRATSFVVEFPDDEPNLAVRSISFDADTLPPGATTRSFRLNVGITTPSGGTPPLFVVRAKDPAYREPGTATRTKRASRDSLVVQGVATKGTKVDLRLIVVCLPKS
ncbi:MAG: hypothetical protein SFV24_24585 [Gemmatimonadales bacterium]|nr:hypothetical protein [Gemmatimonadales bacterium]